MCFSFVTDADLATPVPPSKRQKMIVDEAAALDCEPLPSPGSSQKPSPCEAALKKVARYKKRWLREKKRRKPQSPKKLAHRKQHEAQVEAARNLLKDHLTPDALNLVMAQITTKGRRKRWSKELKLYCLSLAYTSTAAYKFLRKTFKIPSIRTLQRMFNHFQLSTGFSPQLLNHLKMETAKMKMMDKYCTICFDEVALTAGLAYERGHDTVKGFVDFGCLGQSKELGNHALVFMASGMFTHWKQPLGYFVSRNSAPALVLKDLLFQCLSYVRSAGFIVKGIICDMGPTNQKLLRSIDVTSDSPFIEVEGEKVFVFFDPPHLLKCVRNNLFAHDFVVDGETVTWRYINDMFSLDSKEGISLRSAPKITALHVNLGAFKKMKVKRAAQILSQSVSAAIMNYICAKKLPQKALATARFVKKMDSLFDIFNSSRRFDPKIFRTALHKNSLSLDFLKECLTWLDTVRVLGLKAQPPCINGWKSSINALLGLWEEVKEIDGIDYLCTRKISQDVLENWFSKIRGKGSFNLYPSVQDFQRRYKLLLLKDCISNSVQSNCEEDSATVLSNLLNELNVDSDSKDCESSPRDLSGEPLVVNELVEALNPEEPQGNVLLYVAGYVAHRFLKGHNCSQCEADLLGQAQDHVPKSVVLIVEKAYRKDVAAHGSLRMPSQGLLRFVRFCETVLQLNVLHILHMPGICMKLANAIMESCDPSIIPHVSCPHFSASKLVDIFIKMRVMYVVRFINTHLAEMPKGKRSLRSVILEKM